MDSKYADQVREIALKKYVGPAKRIGSTEFSIAVKDLLKDLEAINFPRNYTPLVCNSIKTKGFQRENHLQITRIDGPKSQTGTRVVVHYRVLADEVRSSAASTGKTVQSEKPTERVRRLTEGLRGLLRRELADQGGAEAFIRWVRSDDEDAA
jgi:hypothetical protein